MNRCSERFRHIWACELGWGEVWGAWMAILWASAGFLYDGPFILPPIWDRGTWECIGFAVGITQLTAVFHDKIEPRIGAALLSSWFYSATGAAFLNAYHGGPSAVFYAGLAMGNAYVFFRLMGQRLVAIVRKQRGR